MKRSIFSEAWDITLDQYWLQWIGGGIYSVLMLIFAFIGAVISSIAFCFVFVIVLLSRGVDWTLRQEDEL
jgi:hypothetical protein